MIMMPWVSTAPAMSDDNGVLAKVPGEFVSMALKTLPNSSTATGACLQTVIDVPGLGPVRFTCRRFASRKGKIASTFWVAEKAEQVAEYNDDEARAESCADLTLKPNDV